MNTQKIGTFIAKKRHEKNMTQQDLAEKLFLTGKTISRWENGNCMPDLSILIELATILDTSVYELLLYGYLSLHNDLKHSKNRLSIHH